MYLRTVANDWTLGLSQLSHQKIMENPVKVLILQTAANWDALQGPNKKGYQILLLPGMTFAVVH